MYTAIEPFPDRTYPSFYLPPKSNGSPTNSLPVSQTLSYNDDYSLMSALTMVFEGQHYAMSTL